MGCWAGGRAGWLLGVWEWSVTPCLHFPFYWQWYIQGEEVTKEVSSVRSAFSGTAFPWCLEYCTADQEVNTALCVPTHTHTCSHAHTCTSTHIHPIHVLVHTHMQIHTPAHVHIHHAHMHTCTPKHRENRVFLFFYGLACFDPSHFGKDQAVHWEGLVENEDWILWQEFF